MTYSTPPDAHAATLPTEPAIPAAKTPILRIIGVLAIRPVLILAMGLTLLTVNLSLIYTNALVVIVDIVALAVVALAMRAEGSSLLAFFKPWKWVDLAWGALMLVILVVGFLVSNFAANLIVYHGAPPISGDMPSVPLWVGIVALVVAPLTIAVSEEVVYRGYAQARLAGHIGTAVSLILVAVVFGIQHIGFSLGSPEAIASKVLTTLFAGIILGALMLWMRRIAPLVLAHWGLDLVFLGLPTFFLALS